MKRLALLLPLVAFGCVSTPTSSPTTPAPTTTPTTTVTPVTTAATPTAVATTPPPGPPGGGEMARGPMGVSLDQVSVTPEGDHELVLTLDVNSPPAFPVQLTATAPSGAQLVAGQAQETLTLTQPGRVTRSFRVRGPLSAQSPFRVVVHGQAPDRSSGLHADKVYPAAVAVAPPVPNKPPPGGRPPMAPPRP